MSPPLQFTPTPLFGGALTASIPTHFADVSNIRQVPDNQEVFLSTTGFTSVTIDLCERVEAPPPHPHASPQPPLSSSSTTASSTILNPAGAGASASADHHALTYHFFDIVASEDTKRIYNVTHNIVLPHFPNSTPVCSLLAITHPPRPPPSTPAEGKAARNEAKWVGVLMTLIRLVGAQTDLLVVVNVPCVPLEDGEGDGEVVDFEGGVYGRGVQEGREVMEGVVGSLRVVEWGLFGDEGGGG